MTREAYYFAGLELLEGFAKSKGSIYRTGMDEMFQHRFKKNFRYA